MNNAIYKIIAYVGLIIPPIMCNAQRMVEIIDCYCNTLDGVTVEKMCFSNTFTSISLCIDSMSSMPVNDLRHIYATDDNGKRYPLIKNDICDTTIMKKFGPKHVVLEFAPLPVNTQCVDVITSGGRGLYGLHDSSSELSIPNQHETVDPNEVAEDLFMQGTAKISGHIDIQQPQEIYCIVSSIIQPHRKAYKCTIEPNGDFSADIELLSPVWAALSSDSLGMNHIAYFYVRPGEQLEIKLGKIGEENDYNNDSGLPTYSGLMNNYIRQGTLNYRELSNEVVSNSIHGYIDHKLREQLRLVDYLGCRHNLSPYEILLWKNQLKLIYGEWHITYMINERVNGKASKDSENYSFLCNLSPKDPTYMILPSFSLFIHQISRLNLFIEIHDSLIKQDVEVGSTNFIEREFASYNQALNQRLGSEGISYIMQGIASERILDQNYHKSFDEYKEVYDVLANKLNHSYFRNCLQANFNIEAQSYYGNLSE